MKRVICVAAVARNGVIGDGPDIPWSVPGEQRLFKEVTLGHTLVMGRTTYESIGRPLPGRTTIVLTRDRAWRPAPAPGSDAVLVAHGLERALMKAALHEGEVIIAGGAQVYAAALPLASEQILSIIPLDPPGDARYPEFAEKDWEETDREVFDGFERVWLRRVV
ncbi:dihydrofolate reductase [Nocardioides sp. TRM66260-LWL]|uniref:dihydrofolate reductase n=1 Tax=Nocardioides sp. TRM66260-LWL TaxID=2874478 RepID=UPI001CC36A3A|nr:dihydrofolate reductase [Nocardioides sp. TRM66260-LWL]MBZ5733757.1 dihydrofolate reductase [Nocardioides sp. TRM66260-LWL]